MKTNLPFLRTLLCCLAIGVFFTLQSCESCQKDKVQDVQVNPAFELKPPIPTDVKVQLLEKPVGDANTLVSATFPKGEIDGIFHAVNVGDEKVVLRDDGKLGDKTAGDGVFSVALKEDEKAILEDISNVEKRAFISIKQKRPFIKFIGRVGVPLAVNEKVFANLRNFREGIHLKDFGDIVRALPPDPLLKDHSLMINNLSVVEDNTRTFNPCTGAGNPNGAWTFGKLMADNANTPVSGVSVEDFTRNWLDSWMNDVTVNGDLIQARTGIFNRIIQPWLVKSGSPLASITTANWKTKPIDMKFAPFKLLAIVNRLDLRGSSGYGFSDAGEGRFVFGVLTSSCTALTGPGGFTVIFEFGINKRSCPAVHAFAQQWYNLKNMAFGTAFNDSLQKITDQFAGANTNPSKANGSSLNQLRTDEFALGGPVWELREFNIDATSHLLKSVTVKQEPQEKYNARVAGATPANIQILADYATANTVALAHKPSPNHTVPEPFGGVSFLAGKAHTQFPPNGLLVGDGHYWDAGTISGSLNFIADAEARWGLSVSTCSGCHGGETNTFFTHVNPVGIGAIAGLSQFLTGDGGTANPDKLLMIKDRAGRTITSSTGVVSIIERGFNDLFRRAQDLESLVNGSCFIRPPFPRPTPFPGRFPPFSRPFELARQLSFDPIRMEH
jgi:hypothetical protein